MSKNFKISINIFLVPGTEGIEIVNRKKNAKEHLQVIGSKTAPLKISESSSANELKTKGVSIFWDFLGVFLGFSPKMWKGFFHSYWPLGFNLKVKINRQIPLLSIRHVVQILCTDSKSIANIVALFQILNQSQILLYFCIVGGICKWLSIWNRTSSYSLDEKYFMIYSAIWIFECTRFFISTSEFHLR